MRKPLILLTVIWLVLSIVAPALAAPKAAAPKPSALKQVVPVPIMVKVNFNGQQYVPQDAPRFINGTLYTSAVMVARLLGAEYTVSGNYITIIENKSTLRITLGSTKVMFNGQEALMPKAAVMSNGVPMLPLRFAFEQFSAQVKYNTVSQTVSIDRQESRDGIWPKDLLNTSGRAVNKKDLVKFLLTSDESVSSTKDGASNRKVTSRDVCTYMQGDPLVFYTKGTESYVEDDKERGYYFEALTRNGVEYLKVPTVGWTIAPPRDSVRDYGVDIMSDNFDLGYDDDLDDLGALITFANDQEKDGKKYWVVEVTLGAAALQSELDNSHDFAGIVKNNPEVSKMMKNGRFERVCRVWINKNTMLMDYYEINLSLEMKYVDPKSKMRIYMFSTQMKTKYAFSYDIKFDVPDVGPKPPRFEDVVNDESAMNES
ncbi:MAG: copper amine oxidase N-terminal domain-containing protein [Acidobacteriota bacterium]